jgi:hypothetical protein
LRVIWAGRPEAVQSQSKASAKIENDGRVVHREEQGHRDLHRRVAAHGDKLSALRLETAPQAGFGNFVLSSLKAEVVPPDAKAAPQARYVRVELPGEKKMLQLAEVQVFSGAENIAPKGVAKQSSLYTDAAAKRANDGNTDGDYAKLSVAHTAGTDNDPWWEVDLKAAKPVDRVVVWNRTDGNVHKRLEGFRVVLLDDKRQIVWKSEATPRRRKKKPSPSADPSRWASPPRWRIMSRVVLRPRSSSSRKARLGRRWRGGQTAHAHAFDERARRRARRARSCA